MSIAGIIIMWVWTAVIYFVWSKWTMGAESDRRSEYWSRFEDK